MTGDYHIPVLRDVAVGYLVTSADGVYVDGTVGGGGHAEAILEKVFPRGLLVGIDADSDALGVAGPRLERFRSRVRLVHDNCVNLRSILASQGFTSIHGLLLDLGVSSRQLDDPAKGFSFRADEPLDMRMDRRGTKDARTVLQSYSEEEIGRIIREYGEERYARRIARAIIARRNEGKLETTGDLAGVVERSVGGAMAVKSLARVFQALRIEVNNELANLPAILTQALDLLAPGGRIVVIAYHSLEDRIVKNFFQHEAATHIPSGHKLVPDTPRVPRLRILTRKPVRPDDAEARANRRSRSALLRVAEKV